MQSRLQSLDLGDVGFAANTLSRLSQPRWIAGYDDYGWPVAAPALTPDCLRNAGAVRALILAPTAEAWRLVEDVVSAAEAAEVRTGRRARRREGDALSWLRGASLLWIGNLLLAWGRRTPAVSFRWLRAPEHLDFTDSRSAFTAALETLEPGGFVKVSRGFTLDGNPAYRGVVVVPTERLLDRAGALGITPESVVQHFGQPANS
ncbi:hypothetical protein [Siccirubricoccus deserti]|uniref:Uncharacterized protein n=1 Tax=Siccirubricoccus deserti TaxID=2013562 RepID=A0A9X0UJR3_9PROT|nr:hypothetical protein [Siccirubricoccus deserti]MBC4018370.1 hypothetical protein [Siccirubricoccus deserti]